MMQLADEVTDYLKVSPSPFSALCAERAETLVNSAIKTLKAVNLPEPIKRLAICEAAAKLYAWRDAPQGVANYSDIDTPIPIRVSKDALVTAKKLLEPYATAGIVVA